MPNARIVQSAKSRPKTATLRPKKKRVDCRKPKRSTRKPEMNGPQKFPRKKDDVHMPEEKKNRLTFKIGALGAKLLG